MLRGNCSRTPLPSRTVTGRKEYTRVPATTPDFYVQAHVAYAFAGR